MVEERRWVVTVCRICDEQLFCLEDVCEHSIRHETSGLEKRIDAVPASKLKEQEERCERLEEALRWLLSTIERHFEEKPVRNLDEVLSFARTALQHSPEDEGAEDD